MNAPATRKSSPERRQEIAEAVLELIGRLGASALTAARISKVVGVSSGAIFRHYPTTDAMLEAATDLAIGRARACFPARDLPPVERIRGLLLARIETIRAHPGLNWLLLSEQAPLTVPTNAIARLQSLVNDSQAFLKSAVNEAIAQGALRSDVPPATMLVLFSGTVRSLSAPTTVHGEAILPSDLLSPAAVLDTLFQLLAAGSNPSTELS